MNLNGLQSTPPRRPGLLQRLLKREPKENAIIAITNLLAENPIRSVSMPQVAEILKHHDLGFSEVRPQFEDILRRVLTHLGQDHELSVEDRQNLAHLQIVLSLQEEGVARIREEVLADIYSASLADALGDRHISAGERERLEAISASFELPEARRQEIYKSQVVKLLQLTLDRMVEDRRITGAEETAFKAMVENFGVTLQHGGQTQALIDRFRLLARIEEGDLPVVPTEVKLQRGEACHATVACTQSEIRTQTTSYRHSGVSTSIKIIGNVRWRIGQVSVQRVTRDVMTQLDAGTLYVTGKRLLFDGQKKNTSIALGKIVRFTLFTDGVKIEKDTGRDQFFVGDGDFELLGCVLERVLTASRQ